jgi:predicted AAA+ superfamily ATPase
LEIDQFARMTIDRQLENVLCQHLTQTPAVALLGPRQVGKTTLARRIASASPDALLLDLESPADLAALAEPALLLPTQRQRLLVLDDVQQRPELFAALRPEIDADRRPGLFLLTFLQRDLPQLGVRVLPEALRRFWTMLAHQQSQLFNASQLGQALGGASHSTVARYLDTLVDTLMVRRLEPFFVNIGKRLVKSPKVYVRDSGLLHALLGLGSVEALQGHSIVGPSWEGFVVEQVAALLPPGAFMGFYRTAAGAELDLVVELPGGRRLGFEIKFSSSPKPTRGFWQAIQDLALDLAWVLAPVERRYPLAQGVDVLPVWQVAQAIDAATAPP